MVVPPIIKSCVLPATLLIKCIEQFVKCIEERVSKIAKECLVFPLDKDLFITPILPVSVKKLREEVFSQRMESIEKIATDAFGLKNVPWDLTDEIAMRLSPSSLGWFQKQIEDEDRECSNYIPNYEKFWLNFCYLKELRVERNLFSTGVQKVPWRLFFISEYFTKCLIAAGGDFSALSDKDLLLFKEYRFEVTSLNLSFSLIKGGCLEKIVSFFPNLRSLDLSHCMGMSTGELNVLGRLSKLVYLNLESCEIDHRLPEFLESCLNLCHLDLSQTSVDRKVLEGLCRHVPKLSRLFLRCCIEVNDEALEFIGRFRFLRSLDLSYCYSVHGKGLSYLRGLVLLSSLKLKKVGLKSEDTFRYLSEFPSLQQLDISGCNSFSGKELCYLQLLSSLSILRLNECAQLTNDDLKEVGRCEGLKELYLTHNHNFTSKGVKHLSSLLYLETVSFTGCIRIDSAAVGELCCHRRLTHLDLSFCYSVTDSIDQMLLSFPFLEKLMVRSTSIGDDVLGTLNELKRLNFLDISCCTKITKEGMLALENHRALETLWLHNCEQLSLSLFRRWASSPLKELSLMGSSRIKDEHLFDLLNLKYLNNLELNFCDKITDKGIQKFKDRGFKGKVIKLE
jgi:hypothetical protein